MCCTANSYTPSSLKSWILLLTEHRRVIGKMLSRIHVLYLGAVDVSKNY